ncbi:MAG TPA: dihydrodipicolinate synthase family protein [Caldilineae bacterium]|nr:dihydrodipicolinate synthase family protein [Caldilineae bacterium]
MNLHGIIPACITPFIDGKASPDAVQHNINRWLTAGVHGLLIFGSTGEFPYVTDDERRAILQAARAATPSDRLLLAGCGAESTQQTLRNLQWAAEDGADAALVVTPVYYTRGKTEAQRRYFLTLAAASPIPVMIYTVPAFTAYDLPADLILELAQHPNIIGMKESTGDLRKVTSLVNQKSADFTLFAGSPNLIFPALALGAEGSITALANIIPEIMVTIWQAVQTGELTRAATLQKVVTQLYDDIIGYGIPGYKAILAQRGFMPGEPRSPLASLAPEAAPLVIRAWEQAMNRAGF